VAGGERGGGAGVNNGAGTETCPTCGAAGVGCIDSRAHPWGRRRRRECSRCLHRWTTVEMPLETAEALMRTCIAVTGAARTLDAALKDALVSLPKIKELAE
jgi:transcriptional regulator NrdR family protein